MSIMKIDGFFGNCRLKFSNLLYFNTSLKQTKFSFNQLRKITLDLKKKGKRIVMTHGAFDLFHRGHLDLIQKSSLKANFLIVGVESDENISNYKNILRPIIDEDSRVEIINELSW